MKVYVVHGPPLSGKTTYVNKHKGPNDLVYDFDHVMAAISGLPVHQHNDNLIGYVLDIRDLIVNRLKRESRIDNAWIITTKIRQRFREQLQGLDVEYIRLIVDKQTALKRLQEDPDGRNVEEYITLIRTWQNEKERRIFYKSPEWRRVRELVIERDNYECQHCKAKGKFHKAECVHHIKHLEDRPDLALEPSNLISLCYACHNLEHPEKFPVRRVQPRDEVILERW